MLRDSLKRARQPNLSFFAFTATPKFKTKTLFDEPGPTGTSPFHEYTMKQAIEEGFIMDVLQNYTTYKRFFGLIKQVENDPDVPRKKDALRPRIQDPGTGRTTNGLKPVSTKSGDHQTAPAAVALELQRPLPDDALRVVARGERKDEKPALTGVGSAWSAPRAARAARREWFRGR